MELATGLLFRRCRFGENWSETFRSNRGGSARYRGEHPSKSGHQEMSTTVTATTASLLDSLKVWVRRYVVVSEDQLNVLAAWVLHTWAMEAAECTPYLHITAPEKGCGKSRVLETLEAVVWEPCKSGGMTAAALLRTVHEEKPTLLLDELDAAFGGEKEYKEALRGILNEGFRRGGNFRKCDGKNHDLKVFEVFCPKALAGIGKIPETIASRSIVIEMRRRKSTEQVERLRVKDIRDAAAPLRESLAEWSRSGAVEFLVTARPALPDAMGDRQQDISEPLLAIAELARGDWPERLANSLLRLFGSSVAEDNSVGVQLLTAIRDVFAERSGNAREKIFSSDLAAALFAREGEPWAEWSYGKGMNADRLAKALGRYEIHPKSVRLGSVTMKGYERDSFSDLWARYCSEITANPPQGVTAVTTPIKVGDSLHSRPSHTSPVTRSTVNDSPRQSYVVTTVTGVTAPADVERVYEGEV
jgi:Protein of unknown function (DUF3631)